MVAPTGFRRRVFGCLTGPGAWRNAASLCLCTAALPAGAGGISGAIGLTSDHIVYGISQSGGRLSAVVDAAYRADAGWALTAGVATLGRDNPRGSAQWNWGAGLGGAWNDDWSWQAALARHATLGSGGSRRPSYALASLGAGWRGRLQLTAAVSPDYPGARPGIGPRRGWVSYLEATVHQPLGLGWAVDAGIGHADYGRLALPDYDYGSVGFSWGRGSLQLYASRIVTNSAAPAAAKPRVVLTALWAF